MLPRKPLPGGDAARLAARQESKLFAMLPNVILHVSLSQYDDGTPRTPGWIILRTFRGLWEVVAKEPDTQLQLAVADANLDDAFVLLETLMGDAAAPWQKDPYLTRNGPKKKPDSR